MDEMVNVGLYCLGRVTYEGFAQAWPSRTGEFADMMNGMPKHVVSRTMKQAAWNNSNLIKSDVAEAVRKLKTPAGKDILVAGSGMLVQALIQGDLVDEYRLMVFPVILGKGARLFRDGYDKLPLRMVEGKDGRRRRDNDDPPSAERKIASCDWYKT